MPRKLSRAERRANRGLVVISLLVVGSLALSAVISLVDPVQQTPTPAPAVLMTEAPTAEPSPSAEASPTFTPISPAPPPGPAVAPTQ